MRYEITLNGKVYEVEVVDNRALVGAIQDAIPLPEPSELALANPGRPVIVRGPQTVHGPQVVGGRPRVVVSAPGAQPGGGRPVVRPAGSAPVAAGAPTVGVPTGAAAAPRGEVLPAPMPGLIKELKVQPGKAVKAGQVLAILEAMKMENEIVAPAAGTVTEILVAKGQTVSAGAPILRLAK